MNWLMFIPTLRDCSLYRFNKSLVEHCYKVLVSIGQATSVAMVTGWRAGRKLGVSADESWLDDVSTYEKDVFASRV